MKRAMARATGLKRRPVWDAADDSLSPPGLGEDAGKATAKFLASLEISPSPGRRSGYPSRCTVFRALINQRGLCSACLFVP